MYPCRACSNDQYQGHRITLPVELFYAVGDLRGADHKLLRPRRPHQPLGAPMEILVRPGRPRPLPQPGLAFYSCHFVHRKRIEARCTVLGQYGRQVRE